jgi:hypothetical protein
MANQDIRAVLLQVIADFDEGPSLQAGSVMRAVSERLTLRGIAQEQALLTLWADLFRSGYLAWGYNLSNINPPFCHLTDRGRRLIANLSRDPANAAGYLAHVDKRATLNPVANSYLREALETFNAGSYKSAAVMLGGASESLVLEIRDALIAKMASPPAKLLDWRIKTVLSAIEDVVTQQKKAVPNRLFESFESYWPAFTQQIRSARNDAGHPISVAPIDEPTVHAGLLIFPELADVASALLTWIAGATL